MITFLFATILCVVSFDCLSTLTMENHIFLLQFKCRGCKDDLEGMSHPLDKWCETIKTLFDVDIKTDDSSIHPTKICGKCRSTLNRLQSAIDRNLQTSTSMVFSEFTPHSDQCSICFATHDAPPIKKPRRGKGKRTGGPGRGKRATVAVPMVPTPAGSGAPIEESQPSTSAAPAATDAPVDSAPATTDAPVFDKYQPARVPPNQALVEAYHHIDLVDRDAALQYLMSNLSIHEKCVAAQVLGKSQACILRNEAEALRGEFKDISKLKNFDLKLYIQHTNPVVKSFLEGACQLGSVDTDNRSNSFLFACLFDVLYKLRVPTIITPFSFMRSLTLFVSQERKWAAKVNAATSPGGSYTTISEWLKDQTNKSEPTAPDGDILNVFDNDQVIGKSYTVKPNNRVNMSIITNRAWIVLDASGLLQQRYEFMPGKWMGETERLQQTIHSMIVGNDPIFQQYTNTHKEAQRAFLQRALQEVKAEQVCVHDGYEDDIDRKVEELKINRISVKCLECEDLVPKRKKKCTGCGTDMTASKKQAADAAKASFSSSSLKKRQDLDAGPDEERYSSIPSYHTGQPTKMKVADPVLCNPNSYDSLVAVLRKIGLDAGIFRYGGQKRHWTVVCCDGLPYHLCLKLIDGMLTCTTCKSSFFGEAALLKHHTSSHADIPGGPNYYREFDWVVLRIGAGHYEMNMIKSFTELNWKPFLSDLCGILSFKSPAAQFSAKRCDSHHKAWTVFVTFFMGALKELVLDYVRECLEDDKPVTPEGYLEFAEKKRHIPNFAFLHDQVLVYSLAIVNFRMGIRRNNSKYVDSAKHYFRGVFFGRHHPIYAKIEVHDTLQRFLLPEPVKKQLQDTVSFSVSGDKGKGQDADFLLEEVNKDSKSWISRGVPDDSTWLTICRNLDDFKTIKNKVKEISNTRPPSSEGVYRKINVDANVEAWQCRLRETGYLRGDDVQHSSITGDALHRDLANFKRLAEAKRSNRLSSMFLGRPDDSKDVQPVFIDAEEDAQFNSIDNKTVVEIKKMIQDGIQQLISNEEDQDYLLSEYSKTRKKADFVSLYHEIQTLHSNQILQVDEIQQVDAEAELD